MAPTARPDQEVVHVHPAVEQKQVGCLLESDSTDQRCLAGQHLHHLGIPVAAHPFVQIHYLGYLRVAESRRSDDYVEGGDSSVDLSHPGEEVPNRRGHVGLGRHVHVPGLFGGWEGMFLSQHGEVVGPAEQCWFGVEDEVDGLHRHPRPLGHHGHGRPCVPALTEELIGSLDDPPAGGGRALPPRRGWRARSLDRRHSEPLRYR